MATKYDKSIFVLQDHNVVRAKEATKVQRQNAKSDTASAISPKVCSFFLNCAIPV